MSSYSEAQALRQSLREQVEQKVSDLCERFDRLYIGDEAYDHFLEVSEHVEREEAKRREEQMREAVAISRRNRGEE